MSLRFATGITDEPLDTGALINGARRDVRGAVLLVRNHDGGESVDAVRYSHPSSQRSAGISS